MEEKLDFQKALTRLLNEYCLDNKMNTPDFLLAEYLITCLQNYEWLKKRNDDWHSFDGVRKEYKMIEQQLDIQQPGWRDL